MQQFLPAAVWLPLPPPALSRRRAEGRGVLLLSGLGHSKEPPELVFNSTINGEMGDRYGEVERRHISVSVTCY